MTARLNRLVKMSNCLINFFPSCFFSGKDKFSHFDHFFADRFFVNQEGVNAFKNWVKLKIRNSPKHLVSAIRDVTFIQKMKLSPKFSGSPIKKWSFSIIALKLRSICWIFPVFLHCLVNIKTAFGIYKASKIGKVARVNATGVSNGFNLIFNRIRNQIRFFFDMSQCCDQRRSGIFKGFAPEINKNITFFFFFNKIGSYFWEALVSFFGKHKVIGRKSIFLPRYFDMDISFKVIHKPLNIFNVSGYDGKGILEKRGGFYFPKTKTSVSVDISSCISQPSFIHAIKYSIYVLFKSSSNRQRQITLINL